jgi:uncharacterized RDD family membrane protein YckC
VRPDLLAVTNAPSIGGFAVPEHQKDLLVQQMREGVLVEAPQSGALQYMGFWWRVLARIIDNIVVSMVACIFAVPLGALIGIAGASSNTSGTTGLDMVQIGAQLTGNAISLIVQAIYFTWLVGKYGSTLGKMAIGAKVVMEDGGKVSYGRSFGRWAAEGFLNGTIMAVIVIIPIALVAVIGFGGFDAIQKGQNEAVAGMIFALVGAGFVGALAGSFPWWMCGFDKEKRTLHDRICATRVVRK